MKPGILLFILSIFFLTGCISERKIEMRYFTIEIPVDQITTLADSISQIKGNCEIEEVAVDDVYDKIQIVNRAESNEISYYIYNQWAINPSDAITQVIRNYFEVTGIFQDISDRYSKVIPDFRLWTHINSLELIEMNKTFSAHLALEFRLIDNSNNKIIISYKADRKYPLEQKDLNLFAYEISKILQEELSKFAGMIMEKRYLIPANPDKI
jgi:ABC-type uncharacterized transport system auxiliary subunit